METVTMTAEKLAKFKREQVLEIRSAQVAYHLFSTSYPLPSKEEIEIRREKVATMIRDVEEMFPGYRWQDERFSLDFMYQLYCDDYPDSENEEY